MQSVRDSQSTVPTYNTITEFVVSDFGRIARVGIGAALVGIGIGRGGVSGGLVSALGLEPLLAGLFNFSLLSMMSGTVIQGEEYNPTMPQGSTSHVGSGTTTGY